MVCPARGNDSCLVLRLQRGELWLWCVLHVVMIAVWSCGYRGERYGVMVCPARGNDSCLVLWLQRGALWCYGVSGWPDEEKEEEKEECGIEDRSGGREC